MHLFDEVGVRRRPRGRGLRVVLIAAVAMSLATGLTQPAAQAAPDSPVASPARTSQAPSERLLTYLGKQDALPPGMNVPATRPGAAGRQASGLNFAESASGCFTPNIEIWMNISGHVGLYGYADALRETLRGRSNNGWIREALNDWNWQGNGYLNMYGLRAQESYDRTPYFTHGHGADGDDVFFQIRGCDIDANGWDTQQVLAASLGVLSSIIIFGACTVAGSPVAAELCGPISIGIGVFIQQIIYAGFRGELSDPGTWGKALALALVSGLGSAAIRLAGPWITGKAQAIFDTIAAGFRSTAAYINWFWNYGANVLNGLANIMPALRGSFVDNLRPYLP